MRKLIVDGNNLLHRVRETAELAKSDFAGAKRLLCRILADFAQRSQAQVAVVFDGYAGTSGGFGIPPNVRAVHTTHPETADERIMKIVRAQDDPGSICVVTDDYKDIVEPARALGARTASSSDFAESLAHGAQARRLLQEKPSAPATKEELRDWMEFFGEDEG
jgi:predicted RNA-binding protein with PIN domain